MYVYIIYNANIHTYIHTYTHTGHSQNVKTRTFRVTLSCPDILIYIHTYIQAIRETPRRVPFTLSCPDILIYIHTYTHTYRPFAKRQDAYPSRCHAPTSNQHASTSIFTSKKTQQILRFSCIFGTCMQRSCWLSQWGFTKSWATSLR